MTVFPSTIIQFIPIILALVGRTPATPLRSFYKVSAHNLAYFCGQVTRNDTIFQLHVVCGYSKNVVSALLLYDEVAPRVQKLSDYSGPSYLDFCGTVNSYCEGLMVLPFQDGDLATLSFAEDNQSMVSHFQGANDTFTIGKCFPFSS